MKELGKLALDHYQQRGFVSLMESTVRFIQNGFQVIGYQDRRTDNELRWSIIDRYLSEDDTTLLDIGCAQGYFTNKAADHGLRAIGIDGKRNRILAAQNRYNTDNLDFKQCHLTPTNIWELPVMDVVLLLSVHHHWATYIGFDESVEMFKVVAHKGNKIFYEPSGSTFLGQKNTDYDESLRLHREFILSNLGDSVEILYTGKAPRKPGDTPDPFFVLDTSAYEFEEPE